jgi:hypothetical protein
VEPIIVEPTPQVLPDATIPVIEVPSVMPVEQPVEAPIEIVPITENTQQ